jgi:hypothetical protein
MLEDTHYELGMKDKKGGNFTKQSQFPQVSKKTQSTRDLLSVPNMEIYTRGTFEPIVEPKVFDLSTRYT